jgi:hypothetical protein
MITTFGIVVGIFFFAIYVSSCSALMRDKVEPSKPLTRATWLALMVYSMSMCIYAIFLIYAVHH